MFILSFLGLLLEVEAAEYITLFGTDFDMPWTFDEKWIEEQWPENDYSQVYVSNGILHMRVPGGRSLRNKVCTRRSFSSDDKLGLTIEVRFRIDNPQTTPNYAIFLYTHWSDSGARLQEIDWEYSSALGTQQITYYYDDDTTNPTPHSISLPSPWNSISTYSEWNVLQFDIRPGFTRVLFNDDVAVKHLDIEGSPSGGFDASNFQLIIETSSGDPIERDPPSYDSELQVDYVKVSRATFGYIWNTGGAFDLRSMDSGYKQRVMDTPWGRNYWGINGYSWTQDGKIHSIESCRFYSDGYTLSLYGKEVEGKYGTVACIQGDVWSWNSDWNQPPPMIYQGESTILIYFKRMLNEPEDHPKSRIMFAIDVWLTSPLLENKITGAPKRLVLDLIFHVGGNDNVVKSFEDPDSMGDHSCFHYQHNLAEEFGEAPHQNWKIYKIPLSRYIQQALENDWKHWDGSPASGPITYAVNSLRIVQVEFLIEIVHAEAEASIDNFYFVGHAPWDFYGPEGFVPDGVVDIFDIVGLAKTYGTELGDPEYDYRADIENQDGRIDIYDIVRVAAHFTEMYPYPPFSSA